MEKEKGKTRHSGGKDSVRRVGFYSEIDQRQYILIFPKPTDQINDTIFWNGPDSYLLYDFGVITILLYDSNRIPGLFYKLAGSWKFLP